MDAFSLEDQSFIHDRTAELAAQHRKYLEQHPELTQLLHDFVTNCLVNKPDDCFQFCNEFFTGFLGGDGVGDFVDGWGYSPCRALLLVGPSGTAKRQAAQRLCRIHDDKFALVTAHTTREPRLGEKDGVDFVFTSNEALEIAISAGEVLGMSTVEGEGYAVTAARWTAVAEARRVGVIPCDLDGALAYKRALAGDFAPRVVLVQTAPERLERQDRPGREEAGQKMYSALAGKKGFIDWAVQVELDDDGAWTSESMDRLVDWSLAQDWRVLAHAGAGASQTKAATMIQSQARRRRDINRQFLRGVVA